MSDSSKIQDKKEELAQVADGLYEKGCYHEAPRCSLPRR